MCTFGVVFLALQILSSYLYFLEILREISNTLAINYSSST